MKFKRWRKKKGEENAREITGKEKEKNNNKEKS